MDFPVESYSFLPGSRAILDLSYRSRLRLVSQQSRPTMSMDPRHMVPQPKGLSSIVKQAHLSHPPFLFFAKFCFVF